MKGKRMYLLCGIFAAAIMIAPTFTACSDPVGSSYGIFTSIADLDTHLSGLSINTAGTAYTVKLNVNNLGGGSSASGSVGKILSSNSTKYVRLDLSGSAITSIEDNAFDGCTNLVSIILPNSVTSIGISAFNRCTALTSVNIPNRVTSIGGSAFQSCSSLTSVNIPNSVTSIGSSAFNRCTALTSVTIPSNVKSLGDWAFGNNTNLISVTFQGTIPAADFSSMGSFFGDLRDKFYATNATNGTPGTYTTTAPVSATSVWTKK